MQHPSVIEPRAHAVYQPAKMGKATLFQSERLLVGLNAFEPGQMHALHAHEGMDKLYACIEGQGTIELEGGRELRLRPGEVVVAPAGVPHGVKNDGPARLLLLAVLAPGPTG